MMVAQTSVPTANDRLKRRNTDVLAVSLIAAVGFHVAVMTLFPPIEVEDWGQGDAAAPVSIENIEIPLPAAPEALARPAVPVPVAGLPDVETTPAFSWTEAKQLPPPPPNRSEVGGSRNEFFTPFEVAPRLTNGQEFQRVLLRAYPRALRDAGIGGVVNLLVHIDEDGRVIDARPDGTSGYDALDEAALSVVDAMRFTAALNRDTRVAVWVRIPVEFRVR